MYTHILVPVEHSPADQTILAHTQQLARLVGARLLLLHVADGLFVIVSARLQAQVHQDAMTAPEGVVKLLDLQPGRTVNFQVHHHLLAPERPAFIENGVGEQTTPFPGMPVGGDELQMMTRIGFVRAGEWNAEMLLLFGEFFGGARF